MFLIYLHMTLQSAFVVAFLRAASALSATSTLPRLIQAKYPCNKAMADLAIAIGKQTIATVKI